jgi:hypothetical protein
MNATWDWIHGNTGHSFSYIVAATDSHFFVALHASDLS